jgi:hypothetical protein
MSAPSIKRDPTRLKIIDDKGFEKVVLIETDLLSIGSDPACGLVLPADPEATIAPRHALIIRDGDAHVLKDESGPRGTRVNGRPIRRTILKHGDEIAVGSSTLRIRFLVEGSRASDRERRQVRVLLMVLAEIHASASGEEIVRRAADGVLALLEAVWVRVTGRLGSAQWVIAAGRAAGREPSPSARIARQMTDSERSLLQKDHMWVPVRCTELPAGAIEAGPREGRPYTEADLEMLEAVAAHVGIALANAERVCAAEVARIASGTLPV